MPKRSCAKCGKEQDLKGGRVCEKGHFICRPCVWETSGLLSSERKVCPLDNTRLS